MSESRVKKSALNAKVNVLFYCITLILSFFSRKVFLDSLGADFVGLTGTLQNLLGFLNLAELGIGASIGYVLYKPIFEKNYEKLNEVISVFGYLYRNVGLVILGAGLLLACFLPFIFGDTIFDYGVIYFAYFSFLTSSLIGYFINYRQTLLGADQKNYVITAYFQSITVAKTLFQMALAYYTGNYYLWILIELAFGIIYSFVLNWKINAVYPWLKSNIAEGKKKYPENKIIITKARQMFVHVLAGVGRSQLLPILVYAFTSLKIVAYYGNYMLFITKINQFVNNFLGSTTAGIGNLIAEGDRERIQHVFWELSSLRFMIAAFLTYALYHFIDPFICIWLGNEYLLEKSVLVIICCNFFISQFRGANDQFIYGYGLFQDTWAPIVTLLITVGVALIGGYSWGLPGVLLGDIASSITIICIWKPYFLYKKGFELPVYLYWINIFKYLAVFIVVWILAGFIVTALNMQNPSTGYVSWLAYVSVSSMIFVILMLAGMLCISKGTRDLIGRFAFLNRLKGIFRK